MNSNPENVPLVRGRLVRDPAELAAWREELLTATGRAAERMLNSQLDAQAFQAALGILGRAAHVDRVYVFAIHGGVEDQLVCSQTYEWCAAGVVPQIDNPDLQNVPLLAAGFGRWTEELSADRPVYGDVSEFPIAEREFLELQGIRSLAVMPVLRHGKLWGFIGFDDCTHWHKWTSDTIGCLHVAARILSAALERLDYQHRSEALEADHRNLVESLDNIVFRLSQDGRWTFLSSAWETQLGWTLPASLGRPAIRFVHPGDRRGVLANWRRPRQEEGAPFRSEVRVLRSDGTLRWMLVNARVQAGSEGAASVMTGTLTDISASKQIEVDLIAARIAAESANKAKSDFLSTMSHELRTPLNAVIGLSESLMEMGASFDADRTKRYLGIIHNSGRQLLAQIDDILELARIEAGRTQLNPVQFDLTSLLSSLAEWAQREARAKSQQVVFQRPPEPMVVNADERLLRQLLQNLVSNAIKFTPPNGRVELRVERRPEGGVTLVVSDTGIGIPEEKRHLLFRPFSQLDSSLGRRFGGTGLGLSLVDRLARLHGATVAVQSVVGQGSTFSVALPVSATPPTPAAIAPGALILLVDDDATQHTLVGDYLEREGFEIIHCQRGKDALTEVSRRAPRVAIVDINMPDMSGIELIGRLRVMPNGARLPILALTALTELEDVLRSRAAGANAHLPKPVSLAALLNSVRQLAEPLR